MSKLRAPVALFVFNRPEHTEQVLAQIAKYDFPDLIVYSDGPRSNHPEDQDKVRRVRHLIEAESHLRSVTLVPQDRNLGLLNHFSFGLRDFFSKYESGIILEDDCLPTQHFFDFCNFGLAEFRDDNRVAMVQGSSFLPRFVGAMGDFYLGKDFKVWGWATWANRLQDFDPKLQNWHTKSKKEQVRSLRAKGASRSNAARQRRRLQNALTLGTWDIQLSSHFELKKLRSLSPSQNLVLNIGFGPEATHTFWGGFTVPSAVGQFSKPYTESRVVLPVFGHHLESINRMALLLAELLFHPSNFWAEFAGFARSRIGNVVRSVDKK